MKTISAVISDNNHKVRWKQQFNQGLYSLFRIIGAESMKNLTEKDDFCDTIMVVIDWNCIEAFMRPRIAQVHSPGG